MILSHTQPWWLDDPKHMKFQISLFPRSHDFHSLSTRKVPCDIIVPWVPPGSWSSKKRLKGHQKWPSTLMRQKLWGGRFWGKDLGWSGSLKNLMDLLLGSIFSYFFKMHFLPTYSCKCLKPTWAFDLGPLKVFAFWGVRLSLASRVCCPESTLWTGHGKLRKPLQL